MIFLFIILPLIAIFLLAMLVSTSRKNQKILKKISEKLEKNKDKNEQFNVEQAEKWFEAGETKALTQYCEQFLKEKPNSSQANWYCGLSYYNQGDYLIAKDYFENVIRINPLWREGAGIYLQEIAEHIGVSPTTTLH